MKKEMKRLYRSESDIMIAGVCGGLGEYFNVDPVILRLAFVLFTLAGGSGVLAYLILWIIVPTESSAKKTTDEVIKENAEELKTKAKDFANDAEEMIDSRNGEKLSGLILIGLGMFFFFGMFGFPVWSVFWKMWPLALIIPGILILLKK